MALTLADALRQTGYAKDGQLQAPAPTQPNLSTMAADYLRQLPEKTAQNAINTNKMVQGVFPTDPFGKPNPDYYPEAMSEFANFVPNLMGATAFHGTPHKIKGLFDINKVGTGEGAQAYGHGMYFAESKDLADVYRKKLTNEAGNPVKNPNDSIQLQMGNLENQIKQLKQSNDPNVGSMIKAYQNRIDEINKAGNLYKVDIPDEQIPNMLDWDKPFKQQTQQVQDLLKPFMDENKLSANAKGVDIYQTLLNVQGKKPSALARGDDFYAGLQKDVSEQLNQLGVKGIRYLDEGSRSSGKGTSNFVVFDPSTVKILEENGIPTRKELIQQQIDKIE
jgi:hypothetical protein